MNTLQNKYWLFGRGKEVHTLEQSRIEFNRYRIVSNYPIQTTGRMNEIIAIDFSGGPTLVVGELFGDFKIDSFEYIGKDLYLIFKNI